MKKFVWTVVCLFFSSVAWAQPAKKPAASAAPSAAAPLGEGQSRKIKPAKPGSVGYKDVTDVNFDDAVIEGAAKNPFMSMVGDRDAELNKGFIKIRYNWHDMLVMSMSGMSQ